jgi:DNA invertase Pin-like site-specific DNA recombinase
MAEPLRRLYGYARVSTEDQDLTLQRDALERYGVDPEWIYEEKASGGSMNRKVLARLLRSMRSEDTLVVWKLDRLGRSLSGVLEVLAQIESDGIHFVSVTESFDTSSPLGKAMLQICLVFAEMERNMISERTKAGMAIRKAQGVRFGAKHMIMDSPKRMAFLRQLEAEGELRDETGKQLAVDANWLMNQLNAKDKQAKQIKNAETVRRWARGTKDNKDPEKWRTKPFEKLFVDVGEPKLDDGDT